MKIRVLVPAILLALSVANGVQAQNGFKEIFNGKDLEGWKGNPDLWSVKDGAITGTTTDEDPIKANTFLVWEGRVANFELELDYKIGAEGNSGIQYRSKVLDKNEFIVGGYQADIDATMKFAGINYEEKGRGILAQRGTTVTIATDGKKEVENHGDAAELGKKIKAEDWNHYRVVAKGNELSHFINGELMSKVIDDETDKSSARGVLAFQVHKGPAMEIQFKNIKLKRIRKPKK